MIDMEGVKPTDRVRLRWRSRRGLLENDLIITRFLDAHEASLTQDDVVALSQLLDLTDTDLLDYILGNTMRLPEPCLTDCARPDRFADAWVRPAALSGQGRSVTTLFARRKYR